MLAGSDLATAKGLLIEWPPLFYAMTSHRTHRNLPLDFKAFPYLKQIYLDRSDDMGAMKSTQGGFSEYVLCREIALAMSGRNVFHVLPIDKLIGRFVRERFDKTVQNSRHYRSAVRDAKGADNVTLKQVGSGTIAFVGSNSPSSFVEFAADDGIVDEYDRCDQRNLLMVEDRLAASKHRTMLRVGQPSITGYGIDLLWKSSKRWRWKVRCGCGEWVTPSFLEHVVRQEEANVWTYADREWEPSLKREPKMLHSCGREIDRRADGEWVAECPSSDRSFYHVGKEFSTMVTLREMCDGFSRGLDDDSAMMRFYNSDLGLPYTPRGAKILEGDLDALVGAYTMPDSCNNPCVAGVDVGSVIHVRINEILPGGGERAVYIGAVREAEELKELCRRYRVVCGVIDAQPEARLSRRVSGWRGWFRCFFHSDRAQDLANPETRIVTANRTEVLDAVKARVLGKSFQLPRNAASLPEYYAHMLSSTRTYDESRMEYVWTESSPDHLLLAEAYLALARRIMAAA